MNRKASIVCAIALIAAVVIFSWRQASTQAVFSLPAGKKPAPVKPADSASTPKKFPDPTELGLKKVDAPTLPPKPCDTLPPSMKYFWVMPADFSIGWSHGQGLGSFATNSGYAKGVWYAGTPSPPPLVAPLHIPEGATVHEIYFEVIDKLKEAYVKLAIESIIPQDPKWQNLGTFSSLYSYSSVDSSVRTFARSCSLNIKQSVSEFQYIRLQFEKVEGLVPPHESSVGIGAIRFGYTIP